MLFPSNTQITKELLQFFISPESAKRIYEQNELNKAIELNKKISNKLVEHLNEHSFALLREEIRLFLKFEFQKHLEDCGWIVNLEKNGWIYIKPKDENVKI